MVYKLALFALLATNARAGIVSLGHVGDEGPFHDAHSAFGHSHSHATSFTHFHGPVEGPVYEVKVPYVPDHDEHAHLHGQHHQDHGYTLDYVAQPKYEFSYGVEDHHTGDIHGQKESRDGKTVKGEYSIHEPGGNIRTVKYHADKDGFHAVVHNSGSNDHSSGVYGGQGAHEVHEVHGVHGAREEHHNLDLGHATPVHEEHQLQEYAVFPSQEVHTSGLGAAGYP
ncbi:histidine-rich glycoprotein-like [Diprion similis]|uniref:histidine-rich glycoprotein-like n=1 Tax=Diprion similis TaxID=362088 RepID=UPI001EF8E23D|nr:histidine-rich glycoprotein-like [Diprion similis]